MADRLRDERLLEPGLGQLMSAAASVLDGASGDVLTITLPVDDGKPHNAGAWFVLNRVLLNAVSEFRRDRRPKAARLVQQLVHAMAIAEDSDDLR